VANTRRIEWQQTAGELGALLLAKRLIKDLQPTYQTTDGRSAKAPVAINLKALHPWPHEGCLGVREHDADTGRSEIHLFDTWCHLATVQDDNELESALADTPVSAESFDLDIYRVLVKRLGAFRAAPTGDKAILRFPAMQR
jgi:hypothetical protein